MNLNNSDKNKQWNHIISFPSPPLPPSLACSCLFSLFSILFPLCSPCSAAEFEKRTENQRCLCPWPSTCCNDFPMAASGTDLPLGGLEGIVGRKSTIYSFSKDPVIINRKARMGLNYRWG